MGLRPGHCYSSKKDRAYTRTAIKVHRRNYIGATPGIKTRQFNMGNPAKHYTNIIDLIVDEGEENDVQLRDNSIESARIAINRYLHRKLGKEGFFMRIHVYPFHILRENKMAQGAHADRIQTGMSKAFGKPIGRAVRVRPGQRVMSVLVDEPNIKIARAALMRAKARLSCSVHTKVGTDVESIGTLPKAVKEVAIEEAKPTEEKKEEAAGEKAEAAPAKGIEKRPEAKKEEKK